MFTRYAPLYLLLVVPGIVLVTAGASDCSSSILTQARHDIHFSDTDLTTLRNDFTAEFIGPNPLLMQKIQMSDSAAPHPSTTRLSSYIKANVQDFSSPIFLIALGFGALIFGFFAASAIAVDLASQSFEERPLELGSAIRSSLARHVWKMLALYLLYVIFFWTVDAILSFIPGAAGDALSSFVFAAQLYILVRLFVTVPALVSEELSPIAALKRSWQLTYRASWRIIGITIALSILLFIGLVAFGTFLALLVPNVAIWWSDILTREHLTINWFLATFPGFVRAAAVELTLSALLSIGILCAFGTVFYYDLRTRHDGPLVYLEDTEEGQASADYGTQDRTVG